jgi:hypothetical protein
VLRQYVLEGRLLDPADLAFHLIFLVLAATAAISKREALHKGFAAAMSMLFTVYIAALFAQLN